MRTTFCPTNSRPAATGLLAALSLSNGGSNVSPAPKRLTITLLATFLLALLIPASADAAPPQLWQACPAGSAAGQCNVPRGVAANPANGHVFVADSENSRVAEFDPLGTFIKTWGWDVVASGPSQDRDTQTVAVRATAGTYTLTFAGQTTVPIAYDATAGTVEASLDALSSIGAAGGSVSVSGGPGDASAGHPYTVTFGGTLAGTNPAFLTANAGALSGGEVQVGAGFEVCVPEDGDTCKAGTPGTGAGQLSGLAPGIALDSVGDVYVADRGFLANPNLRVQRFSPAGQFQLMFGGEVNETRTEEVGSTEAERNLCPVDPGDECKAGTLGTGNGQFGEWAVGDFIAIDSKGTATATDDIVYVGDQDRIQAFDAEGHYTESLPLPGHTVQSLTTDQAGDLYAAYSGEPDVRKLTPTGAELASPRFAAGSPSAVAVDAAGHLYAFNSGSILEFNSAANQLESFGSGEFHASTGLATNLCPGSEAPGNLYVTDFYSSAFEESAFLRSYGTPPIGCFRARTLPADPVQETAATLRGTVNPGGALTSECRFEWGPSTNYDHEVDCAESPATIGAGSAPVPVHAAIGSLIPATTYHFRLLARIGGETERGPDESFKTLGPPVISDEQTTSATSTEASLRALVDPEGLATSYRFDYTTQAEFEAHGFQGAQSTASLPAGSDRTDHPATANLTGLTPGTIYRWRLVATNSSGVAESAAAQTLITYRPFAPETDCPNQALRTAASAFLPDCRAYEMVSPLDKNGGDILSGIDGPADPIGYVQASPDGARIAYSALWASFAGQPTSLAANQYLATRGEEGWSSQGIHSPVPGHPSAGLSREFSAFSADLCSAWLLDPQSPPLIADGQQGLPNLYRRQNCGLGAGGLEALTSSPPSLPSDTGATYVDVESVQGISGDGRRAFFVARAALTDDASSAINEVGQTAGQIYERFEGHNHLVSVLPTGEADATGAAVGSGVAGPGNLDNAVAKDGSRVFWTSGIEAGVGSIGIGRIYLRLQPEQGVVEGECSAAGVACTRAVSATVGAFFWTAAEDGSKALFSEGENLFEFDLGKAEVEEPPRRLIAHHVLGVAGTSEDLSRIYFVSTDALKGEAEGEEAGKPNLYLSEGPDFKFIATLLPEDVGKKQPGAILSAYDLVSTSPYARATRVTPDGSRIAFESLAPLTAFDNADAADGKPSVEVFTYSAGGLLTCVSCNPSGARPSEAREMPAPYNKVAPDLGRTLVPAAAWIPTWEHKLHASNVLSTDGNRIFFNANDALLPRDTNGAQDVYEWEAPDTGSCTTASSSFFTTNGGCLYLISSGQSPSESEFWEADPDGSDVFFTTSSSLLPQDPGSVDLYDARVDGGFPQPTVPAACEGEACQSPPAPPNDPTPASSTFEGAGNVVEPSAKKCAKGRVKRHGRCLRKHHRQPRRARRGAGGHR